MSIHPPSLTLPRSATSAGAFDVMRIRADFPILSREVHGQPLIYFDNAATTQKPQAVLDALMHYYSSDNANIHRAVHLLSAGHPRLRGSASESVPFSRCRRAARNYFCSRRHRRNQPRRSKLGPGQSPRR